MVEKSRATGKSREKVQVPLQRMLFLFSLLRRTSKGRKLTSERARDQLEAAGFSVSLRTVQRYLEDFKEYFNGIHCDTSTPIGWRYEPNTIDDAMHLSKETAIALCLAEAHLKHLIPSNELKHLDSLFQNARKTVEFGGDVSRGKRMIERIWILPRGLQLRPPVIDGYVFDQIMSAIIEQKEVELFYKKSTEKTSRSRKIEPLGLVERSGVYYVVGREKYVEHPKNWALHRIQSVKEGSFFSYPKGFKISDYAYSGALNINYEPKTIKVQLRFSEAGGAHLLESKLADNQQSQILSDGKIEIKATVPNTVEFRWWLMSLSHECEVLSPQSLRDELYEMLLSAMRNFSPTAGKQAG